MQLLKKRFGKYSRYYSNPDTDFHHLKKDAQKAARKQRVDWNVNARVVKVAGGYRVYTEGK